MHLAAGSQELISSKINSRYMVFRGTGRAQLESHEHVPNDQRRFLLRFHIRVLFARTSLKNTVAEVIYERRQADTGWSCGGNAGFVDAWNGSRTGQSRLGKAQTCGADQH